MSAFKRTLLSIAAVSLVGCTGELSGGMFDEMELFAAKVSKKDLVTACQEVKDLCDQTGKGCKAYDIFCKGAKDGQQSGGHISEAGMSKPSGDGGLGPHPSGPGGGLGSDGGLGKPGCGCPGHDGSGGSGGFDKDVICQKLDKACKSGEPWSQKACAVYQKYCVGGPPQYSPPGDGGSWFHKEGGAPSLPSG